MRRGMTFALVLGTIAAVTLTTVRAAPGQAAAAPIAPQAAGSARAPAFEYLGTLRAETGARTVVENGPTAGNPCVPYTASFVH